MDIIALFTFGATFVLAAAMPGPGIAAIVARALGSGTRTTVPMIAGYILGDLLFLTFAVLGLSVIAAKFGTFFMVIKYIGAAYLLFIAYRLWTDEIKSEDIGVEKSGSPWRMFLAGLLVTLGNPKVIVFYLALLPQFVDLAVLSVQDFLALAGVIAVVLGSVLLFYVVMAAKARSFFRSKKARKTLNRSAGTFMAGVAAAIALR